MFSNRIKFAIVFAIVNLHLLANFSFWLYVAFYLPVALYVSIRFVIRLIVTRGTGGKWAPFAVFVGAAFLGLITSLMFISPSGALVGFSRFLFTVPVFFALYLYTDSLETLRQHLMTFVFYFGLAALTIPLQFLTGPIPWFAQASVRADLERYSSLVGSLTSIGIAVGCYLVLVQAFRPAYRLVWLAILAVPSLMSLSKAAIANVAIAILYLVIANRRSFVKMIVGGAILVVAGIAVYAFVPGFSERVDASLTSFGLSNSSITNYDVPIGLSALSRIVTLPLANFNALSDLHNPLVYLIGGGYGMGDTALVPMADSLAPMAHNQFAELLTVFGVIGGGLLIASLVVVLVRLIGLRKTMASPAINLVLVAYVILLLNSLFANGTVYQPASASIFYLALFVAAVGHTFTRKDTPPKLESAESSSDKTRSAE